MAAESAERLMAVQEQLQAITQPLRDQLAGLAQATSQFSALGELQTPVESSCLRHLRRTAARGAAGMSAELARQ
jgi:hypothetical protein